MKKALRLLALMLALLMVLTACNLPEADEDETALTLAVMNLPQKEREAVLLYYYQDMNVSEIAKALGVTQPTVSYRLKRAREKLRQELEGREEP